jgi:hypothetical protein
MVQIHAPLSIDSSVENPLGTPLADRGRARWPDYGGGGGGGSAEASLAFAFPRRRVPRRAPASSPADGGGGGGLATAGISGGAGGMVGGVGRGEIGAGEGGETGAVVAPGVSAAWWWCPGAAAGAGIATNSPGRQVCGCRRIDGSFRNRSAWPQALQIRVPSESSPLDRSEREPPPIEPVLSSFAQTKSFAPQLLHTGGTGTPILRQEARLR